MARRKKRDEGEKKPPPGEARTSLRGLLKGVRIEAPSEKAPPPPSKPAKKEPAPAAGKKPSEGLRGDDRIAYYDAYAGVRRIGGKNEEPAASRPAPIARPDEDASVRARLGALVGGGVRFEIERDDELVRGARAGTAPSVLRALMRRDAVPQATLDLHGLSGAEAELEVVRFVRHEQRRGSRRVCIVHGKGLHSPSGLGILCERVVHVLSEGGAAPVVLAFATASSDHGGSGALMVELVPEGR
jgi:DNA-nicking Smr family endonuclease